MLLTGGQFASGRLHWSRCVSRRLSILVACFIRLAEGWPTPVALPDEFLYPASSYADYNALYAKYNGWTFLSHRGAQQKIGTLREPVDFRHHHYTDLVRWMSWYASRYSQITHLHSIGRSVEGRELLVLVISTSPYRHEPGRPEFKLVGNMHGNEVLGRECLLYLIQVLCENYGSNEYVTRLVNTTRIHILPSMNPDGYENAVEGDRIGYVGRNNSRNFDLNRNFPCRFPQFCGDPLQPEVAAVMKWSLRVPFVLSANLHSGTTVVNYPYDDTEMGTAFYNAAPDESVFKMAAFTYARAHTDMWVSGYRCGLRQDGDFFLNGMTNGAVWYTLSGGMQDWNYLQTNDFEVTVEMNCFKYPYASTLQKYWNEHKYSLLLFIDEVHRGIYGFVWSRDRRPVQGAVIHVHGISHNVTSNKDGDYWRLLVPGRYTITVVHPWYHSTWKNVQVRDRSASRVDFYLTSFDSWKEKSAKVEITLTSSDTAEKLYSSGFLESPVNHCEWSSNRRFHFRSFSLDGAEVYNITSTHDDDRSRVGKLHPKRIVIVDMHGDEHSVGNYMISTFVQSLCTETSQDWPTSHSFELQIVRFFDRNLNSRNNGTSDNVIRWFERWNASPGIHFMCLFDDNFHQKALWNSKSLFRTLPRAWKPAVTFLNRLKAVTEQFGCPSLYDTNKNLSLAPYASGHNWPLLVIGSPVMECANLPENATAPQAFSRKLYPHFWKLMVEVLSSPWQGIYGKLISQGINKKLTITCKKMFATEIYEFPLGSGPYVVELPAGLYRLTLSLENNLSEVEQYVPENSFVEVDFVVPLTDDRPFEVMTGPWSRLTTACSAARTLFSSTSRLILSLGTGSVEVHFVPVDAIGLEMALSILKYMCSIEWAVAETQGSLDLTVVFDVRFNELAPCFDGRSSNMINGYATSAMSTSTLAAVVFLSGGGFALTSMDSGNENPFANAVFKQLLQSLSEKLKQLNSTSQKCLVNDTQILFDRSSSALKPVQHELPQRKLHLNLALKVGCCNENSYDDFWFADAQYIMKFLAQLLTGVKVRIMDDFGKPRRVSAHLRQRDSNLSVAVRSVSEFYVPLPPGIYTLNVNGILLPNDSQELMVGNGKLVRVNIILTSRSLLSAYLLSFATLFCVGLFAIALMTACNTRKVHSGLSNCGSVVYFLIGSCIRCFEGSKLHTPTEQFFFSYPLRPLLERIRFSGTISRKQDSSLLDTSSLLADDEDAL
uniref:Peptidase M14 carboxypeptidase A domain-containing protein n=1 Tax=Trichuris muris TaxID=70415 RepID=A0A5S6QTK6_TRIMR